MRLYYLQKSLSLVFSIGQRVLQLSDLGNNSMGLVHIIEPSPTRQFLVNSVKIIIFSVLGNCKTMWYTCTLLHINDLKKFHMPRSLIFFWSQWGWSASYTTEWYLILWQARVEGFGIWWCVLCFFSAESGLSSLVVISISPQCCLIRKGHPSLVLMPASPHKQHSTNSRPSPILLMMEIFFLGQTGASLVMIKTHCTGHYIVTLSDFPQHFWGIFYSYSFC